MNLIRARREVHRLGLAGVGGNCVNGEALIGDRLTDRRFVT